LLERAQVFAAIRAFCKVLLDLAATLGIDVLVEVVTYMEIHVPALHVRISG
jgi:hypothetical protein